METGQQLKVSSDRLVKPGIEPATPGLQGKRFMHYTTAAPIYKVLRLRVAFFNFLRQAAGFPDSVSLVKSWR